MNSINGAQHVQSLTYRKDIDGLRAFAVLPVVLNHAGIPPFSGGFVGVDIFFVISGYLIGSILVAEAQAGNFSILRFYERRARRILPALLLVMAVCALLGTLFLPPPLLAELGLSIQATTFFFANIWFYQQGQAYFAPDTATEPLLHTWSLAVEEQFYIVFPLLVWLLVRRHGALTVITVLACVASFVACLWLTPRQPSYAFYITLPRAWELGVGVLLALGLPRPGPKGWVAQGVGLAGLMAILLAIFAFHEHSQFPGYLAVLPVFGTAAIIWSGSHGQTGVARFLSWTPFVWVGLISYSLYLWHWPIQVAMRLRLGSNELPFLWALAAVVIAVGLAWVSWRFVERPFRKPAPAGFSRKSIFLQSATGMAVVFAVGSVFVETKGLRDYASPETQRILAAMDEKPEFARCNGMKTPYILCPVGPDGPPVILFWGDSHGRAAAPGLAAFATATQRSAHLFSVAGCLPLIGIHRPDHTKRDICSDNVAFALDHLTKTPSIRTVVLIARWPLSVEGTRVGNEYGAPVIIRAKDSDGLPLGVAENHDVMAHALDSTVSHLRELGVRVVLLGTVPETGAPIPDQLALHHSLGAPHPVGPDRDAVEARQARSNAMLEQVARRDENVVFVTALESFCEDVCKVVEGDQPLYSDDDHLSVLGALQVLPPLLTRAFAAFE